MSRTLTGGGDGGAGGTVVETWDWTRIQQERCPECGLDLSATDPSDLGPRLVELAETWQRWLTFTAEEAFRHRRDGTPWTPAQYACHTRDLLVVFDGRINRTLTEDDPLLGWWDYEADAARPEVLSVDKDLVGGEIIAAAETLSATLAGVSGSGWNRPARRRRHEAFTVAGMARFSVHEVHHHLGDARRVAADHSRD